MRPNTWALAFGALWLAGCDDPLKPTEIVQEPRVLAARVEVEGDPRRAAPFPGERARVRLLVASPELQPSVGFALIACRAKPSNIGLGACREPPFAESTRLDPDTGAPELDFLLPEPDEVEARPRLLVTGVVCPDGSPIVSDTPSACETGDALRVSFELDLATELEQNQNPSFEAASIGFDAEEFGPAPALDVECRGSGLPEITSGSTHRIRLMFPESTRDRLERETSAAADRESILISHFASAGDLERAFTPIAAETAEIVADIAWTAPEITDTGGSLVRFWFVVRDLRGGSDFTERALCVVP